MRGFLFALGAAFAAAACSTDTAITKPTRVGSQDQAAAVLVTPTNVVQWDQVAAAMQPNFALSGDQALTQVLPATERIQEQVLSAFGASLGVGLPQSFGQSSTTNTAKSSTTTTTPTTGPATTSSSGSTDTNSGRTTTTQPGVVPTVPSGVPTGGQLPSGPSVAGDVGLDPVLKYQAALSLFESVQMMNREVQNAAILRCYVPFLVRVRLAVLPYRPNLAYTLDSRIAFFPSESTTGSGTTPLLLVGPNSNDKHTACNDGSYLPQIVPILAADDIERALKSRATEAAQQIGLALSAMVHGVGANLGLNNVNQSLNSISGQDFNSRLTIARQSDNTLYVRIGATEQATAGTALVAQNYDIAVLLLAPRAYFCGTSCSETVDRQIRLVTSTQFRDALDGSLLDERPATVLVSQADRVMKQVLAGPGRAQTLQNWNALNATDKERVARTLAGPIQRSAYGAFLQLLQQPIPNTDFSLNIACKVTLDAATPDQPQRSADCDLAQALWVAASPLLTDTALKSAFFQLRHPEDVELPVQTALVLDDGKSTAQTRLSLTRGSSAATLIGTLNLKTKAPHATQYSLPSQSVALDPTAHLLSVTFPSPAYWGIKDVDTSVAGTNLTISQVGCTTESLCPQLSNTRFSVLLAKAQADDATPNFTLAQAVTLIVLSKANSNGSAKALLSKLTDDSATLTVAGADLVSASDGSGAALTVVNGAVTVTKDTAVTFNLTNLHTGAVVTVTAEGKKAGTSTGKKALTYTVVTS
jgi:hypothetical protein